MILHAHELGPTIFFCCELHRGELVSPHTAGTYVPYFSAFNKIMKCFHCLFNWDCFVKAVNLKKINIWRFQPIQGRVDSVENALTGKATLIYVVNSTFDVFQSKYLGAVVFASCSTAFGAYNQLMPWYLEFLDCFCDDSFRSAITVDVGGVPGINPPIVGGFEERKSLGSRHMS